MHILPTPVEILLSPKWKNKHRNGKMKSWRGEIGTGLNNTKVNANRTFDMAILCKYIASYFNIKYTCTFMNCLVNKRYNWIFILIKKRYRNMDWHQTVSFLHNNNPTSTLISENSVLLDRSWQFLPEWQAGYSFIEDITNVPSLSSSFYDNIWLYIPNSLAWRPPQTNMNCLNKISCTYIAVFMIYSNYNKN